MPTTYIDRITAETPTKYWINNPTRADTELAIANQAMNCTINPSFCSKLLQRDPEPVRRVIDRVIKETDDDDDAADLVHQRASQWVLDRFRPLYERSGGAYGYVTIQADPREDEDADAIVEASLRHSRLGKNYMAKIPVTLAGTEAMEALIPRDIPICATEMFATSQTIYVCELYRATAKRTGKHPPFFVTHITGIFDEYLGGIVKSEGIDIAPEVLWQAGCIIGRKQYWLIKERGYQTTVLLGGVRGAQHFTEFVGGDIHCTMNWSTVQELIDADEPVVSRIDAKVPEPVVEELLAKLPHFHRAFHEDALPVEQFKDFGPVVHFRNSFMAGYSRLLEEIAARRRLAG